LLGHIINVVEALVRVVSTPLGRGAALVLALVATVNLLNASVAGFKATKFGAAIAGALPSLAKLKAGLKALKMYLLGVHAAFTGAAAGGAKLKTVLLALKVNPIILALTAVSAAIVGIVAAMRAAEVRVQAYIDAADELVRKNRELDSTIRSNTQTLRSLENEFDDLSRGVDRHGNNIALTEEEYQRYLEIVNQIVDINPGLIDGWDDQGNAIIRTNDAIRESIELMEKQEMIRIRERASMESTQVLIDGLIASEKQLNSEMRRRGSEGDDLRKFVDRNRNLRNAAASVGGTHHGSRHIVESRHVPIIAENYREIMELAKLAGASKEEIAEFYRLASNFTDRITPNSDEAQRVIREQMSYTMRAVEGYGDLSREQQVFLTTIVESTIDFDNIDLDDFDVAEFKTLIIELTEHVIENADAIAVPIETLLDIDTSSMSAREILQQSNNAINKIAEETNLNSVVVYTKVQPILDFSTDDFVRLRSHLIDLLGSESLDEIELALGNIPLSELQGLVKILDEIEDISERQSTLNIFNEAFSNENLIQQINEINEAFENSEITVHNASDSIRQAIIDAFDGAISDEVLDSLMIHFAPTIDDVAFQALPDLLRESTTEMNLLNQAQREMDEAGTISEQTLQRLIDAGFADYIDISTGAILMNVDALKEQHKQYIATQIATARATIAKNNDTIAEHQNTIAKYKNIAAKKDQVAEAERLISVLEFENEGLEESARNYEIVRLALNDLSDVYREFSDILSSNISDAELLNRAYEEMREYGEISINTLQALARSGIDFLDYLDESNGKLRLNVAALQANQRAQIENEKALEQAAIAYNDAAISANNYRIATLKSEGATQAEIAAIEQKNDALEAENAARQANIRYLGITLTAKNNLTRGTNDLAQAQRNLNNDIRSNADLLTRARVEMITYGELSRDTLWAMFDEFPDLMQSYGSAGFFDAMGAELENQANRIGGTAQEKTAILQEENWQQERDLEDSYDNRVETVQEAYDTIEQTVEDTHDSMERTQADSHSTKDRAVDQFANGVVGHIDDMVSSLLPKYDDNAMNFAKSVHKMVNVAEQGVNLMNNAFGSVTGPQISPGFGNPLIQGMAHGIGPMQHGISQIAGDIQKMTNSQFFQQSGARAGDVVHVLDKETQQWFRAQVNSFSDGYHLDWFPADEISRQVVESLRAEGNRGRAGSGTDWNARQAIVVADNGVTSVASFNTAPHASSANWGGGVTGHACLHFLESQSRAHGFQVDPRHQTAIRNLFGDIGGWVLNTAQEALPNMLGQGAIAKAKSATGRGLAGNQNAATAYRFFREKGLSHAASAAILGTLMKETTAIDPNLHQQLGGGRIGRGRGIMQWETGSDRWANLNQFARQRGTEWNNLITQLEFAWQEMQTNDIDQRMRGNINRNNWTKKGGTPFAGGWQEFIQSNDVERAAIAFDAAFTRSADRIDNGRIQQRVGYAIEAFNAFAGMADGQFPMMGQQPFQSFVPMPQIELTSFDSFLQSLDLSQRGLDNLGESAEEASEAVTNSHPAVGITLGVDATAEEIIEELNKEAEIVPVLSDEGMDDLVDDLADIEAYIEITDNSDEIAANYVENSEQMMMSDTERSHRMRTLLGQDTNAINQALARRRDAAMAEARQQYQLQYEQGLITSEELNRLATAAEREVEARYDFLEDSIERQIERTRQDRQLRDEAFAQELRDLQYSFDRQLITEEDFLNQRRDLIQKHYGDSLRDNERFRDMMLENDVALRQIEERRLTYQLDHARDIDDFESQIRIYRQLQGNVQSLLDEFIERGFAEDSLEVMGLRAQIRGYEQDIRNVIDAQRQMAETILRLRLDVAIDTDDFDSQLEILKEMRSMQQEIVDELNSIDYGAIRDEMDSILAEWNEINISVNIDADNVESVIDDSLMELREKYFELSLELDDVLSEWDDIDIEINIDDKDVELTDENLIQLRKRYSELSQEISNIVNEWNQANIEISINDNIELTDENLIRLRDRYRELQQIAAEEVIVTIDLMEAEAEIRALNSRIIQTFGEMAARARESFERELSRLDFRMSVTLDSDYSRQEDLLNQKIEQRLALSQKLLDQYMELQLTVDENVKSTREFQELMQSLVAEYDANVKAIYDLVQAQRNLAESQVSHVRDINNRIIDIIRQRYQDEFDAFERTNRAKLDALNAERDAINDNRRAQLDAIDEELKSWQDLWAAEDRRRRDETRQRDIDDLDELRSRANRLMIAANSGDAEAISRLEDINRQIRDRGQRLADQQEQDQRQDIRDDISARRDAVNESFDNQNQAVEDRIALLQDELQAMRDILDENMKNENLQAEARKKLARGLTDYHISLLHEWENRFGEGMGILGDYVRQSLEDQVVAWQNALGNLDRSVTFLGSVDGMLSGFGDPFESLSERQDHLLDAMSWKNALETLARGTDFLGSVDGVLSRFGDSHEGLSERQEQLLNEMTRHSERLESLSDDQMEVIKQMEENTRLWKKATDELERAALLAENRELGESIGLTYDDGSGAWYLDEEKTELAFSTLRGIHDLIMENSWETLEAHNDELKSYNEIQAIKTRIYEEFSDSVQSETDFLYRYMINRMEEFGEEFEVWIEQMKEFVRSLHSAIKAAMSDLNLMSNTARSYGVEIVDSSLMRQLNNSANGRIERFATGGQVRTGGLAILDPNERVLTAAQTAGFNRLVSNLDNFNQLYDSLMSKNDFSVNGNQNIGANFNFYGSITQEAMPQIQRMMDKAVGDLRKDVPHIVSNRMIQDGKQRGTGFRR